MRTKREALLMREKFQEGALWADGSARPESGWYSLMKAESERRFPIPKRKVEVPRVVKGEGGYEYRVNEGRIEVRKAYDSGTTPWTRLTMNTKAIRELLTGPETEIIEEEVDE